VLAFREIVSHVSEIFSALAFLQVINIFAGVSALETGPWIIGLLKQYQCGLGFSSPIDSRKSKSYYLINAKFFFSVIRENVYGVLLIFDNLCIAISSKIRGLNFVSCFFMRLSVSP
jgi:hypothetical protein